MSNITHDAELRMPGDLIYLRPVRSFIKELAENIGFCRKRVSDIELAVDEVFSNAVEHGSAGSGSWITIRCLPTDDMISVIISDTGGRKGSSRTWLDAWSNALREETQSGAERGRGLLLAHNLTDEMTMKPNSMGGVDVHLVVYREGQRVVQK